MSWAWMWAWGLCICMRAFLCSVGLASMVFWLFALPSLPARCLRFICWISVCTSCKTFATFASVILRRLRFSLACVCCLACFTSMHMLHFCLPCCPRRFFLQSEKCVSKRRVLQTEHVQFPCRWQAVHTRALFAKLHRHERFVSKDDQLQGSTPKNRVLFRGSVQILRFRTPFI